MRNGIISGMFRAWNVMAKFSPCGPASHKKNLNFVYLFLKVAFTKETKKSTADFDNFCTLFTDFNRITLKLDLIPITWVGTTI